MKIIFLFLISKFFFRISNPEIPGQTDTPHILSCGGEPFVPSLRGAVKGHRSEGRVSDDRVADECVGNVPKKCHGHDHFHGYSYGRAVL